MFIAIVQHTPLWVWGLFAALVALGLSQTRTREASPARLVVLPVAMVGLSVAGVLAGFGAQPQALAAWAAGLALALGLGRGALAVRGARYSAATGRVRLPGSWLPLALIVALFLVKYAAGVALGLHPALAADPAFRAGFSLAYGLFSGLFLARALSLRAVIGPRPGGLRAA